MLSKNNTQTTAKPAYVRLQEYFQHNGINKKLLNYYDVKVENGNDVNFEIHYPYSNGRTKICHPNKDKKWEWDKSTQALIKNCVFGLHQIPANGPLLVLAAGEKDVLSLASIGIPAICFNSETANPDEILVNELKTRFKNLIVLYDSDDAGFKNANRICQKLNIPMGMLPKGDYGKDVTDYIACGKTKSDVARIVEKGVSRFYRKMM